MKAARRRMSERRMETVRPNYISDRSPMIIDDKGGLMAHVITYPYVVPVYYNVGKYNLNKLNEDYHKTTTSPPPPVEDEKLGPWDKIEDIKLPDSFHDNLHSVFSIRNYKQFATEKDAEVYDSDYDDHDYSSPYQKEESEPKKIARRYLKTYFS